MKIYFAGSIRGGRDDADFYFQIIQKLAQYGEVLTEHIGDKKLSSFGQTEINDADIFSKDTNWIREADVIVAEVTTPSLGVGYEIGFAESLGKNIFCIHREIEGRRVSAMIGGNPYPNMVLRSYGSLDELDQIFQTGFGGNEH